MKFIMKSEGKLYTPDGHDAEVFSRSIYKDAIDVHVTTFPPKAGMEEEVHENLSHVFYILQGSMEYWQNGKHLKTLKEGDAVYIPAGEVHEARNTSEKDAVFMAITFPE